MSLKVITIFISAVQYKMSSISSVSKCHSSEIIFEEENHYYVTCVEHNLKTKSKNYYTLTFSFINQ